MTNKRTTTISVAKTKLAKAMVIRAKAMDKMAKVMAKIIKKTTRMTEMIIQDDTTREAIT